MVYVLLCYQGWVGNKRIYLEVNWFETGSIVFEIMRFKRRREASDQLQANAFTVILQIGFKGQNSVKSSSLKTGEYD